MRKKILWWDVLIIIGFLMYFSCLFITKYTIVSLSAMTSAATQIEADPVARHFVDMSYFTIMFMVLAVSFFGGLYFILRRRFLKNPTEANRNLLTFYVFALFFLFLHNILNDLPVLLKII